MPQNLTQRTVNQLIKGLITEAGELNFPENASIDELNCVLNRDGSRSRRKGVAYEADHVLSSFTVSANQAFSYGFWRNPAGQSDLLFLVVQHSRYLSFYSLSSRPYSANEKSFTVDLNTFSAGTKDVNNFRVDLTSINGILVVCSEAINTFYITYDASLDTVTSTAIDFVVRDFDWQSTYSTLEQSITVASVTNQRKYDTYNAGWFGDKGTKALAIYLPAVTSVYGGGTTPTTGATAANQYPPLTNPWYTGKNSTGDFSVTEWEKIQSTSSLTGNGLFKLDFFSKDRATASGIAGYVTEVETNRFTTVEAHAGRIWYAGLGSGKNSGVIMYSQVFESSQINTASEFIGQCLQRNDPTSEDFSDLLETDGGVIRIPEAFNIQKLYSYGEHLFVFADNGVWVIGGSDRKFSPTSYFVNKAAQVGMLNKNSFVVAEGTPFWWSKNGIHTITFDEVSGTPTEQNISISTVQTLWDGISPQAKAGVFASYDYVNKKVYWVYPENDDTAVLRLRRALILDIELKAFYPWRLAQDNTSVIGLFFTEPHNNTDASWVSGGLGDTEASLVTLIKAAPGTISFGGFTDSTFFDFTTRAYSSYVETGYDFIGDLLLKKNAPYVTVYCRSTEDGFTGNEIDGYTSIDASGLLMKAYWDFKETPSSAQQVYRIKPFALVDTSDLTNNQQDRTVITSRLKVRGRGRSMRLRFESEDNKNFIFLGYSVLAGVNDKF